MTWDATCSAASSCERISLFVGVSTVVLAMIIGVVLGLLAGYYGGWIDTIITAYVDLQWAFPNFIIAVYLVAVFGTGLTNVIIAVMLAYIDDFSRVVRGMVFSIREQQFVLASRAAGAGDARIILRHILPNSLAPIIVQATVGVSSAILAERDAVVSAWREADYADVGADPERRAHFLLAAGLALFPGMAITVTVLSINFGRRAAIFDVREYN